MVKTGHPAAGRVADVSWQSRNPRANVELLSLAEVRPRLEMGRFERAEFHVFALYNAGRCEHEVDFESHSCRRGTLIHVAPGQVLRWWLAPGVEGSLLLFRSTYLFPHRPRAGAMWHERFFEEVAWPTALQLDDSALAAAEDWFRRIETLSTAGDDSRVALALLQHVVAATLLDIARECRLGASAAEGGEAKLRLVQRFRADVERSFRVSRRVSDYSERIGCSERTLDRAARGAFGCSAKAYIDARVVLAAKRLLAHTELSVAAIGEDLGFSEPTNFVKFFRARTGSSPRSFREVEQGHLLRRGVP